MSNELSNEMLTFAQYIQGNEGIFKHLRHIRQFDLIASLPQLPLWENEAVTSAILYRIYNRVAEVITASKVYYENELEIAKESDKLVVRYDDDAYGFVVSCSRDLLTITRAGSEFSSFHEWYVKLMPSLYGLIESITSILQDQLKPGRSIVPNAARFRFRFLLYNISREGSSQRVKNFEIMEKLLKAYPSESGELIYDQSDIETALLSMGRTDVSTNRWIQKDGQWRLLRYMVEAPGNRLWESLWFTFDYGGETYTAPIGGQREEFKASNFLREYDWAYVKFLRDAAIKNFLTHLLDSYVFETTPSFLP